LANHRGSYRWETEKSPSSIWDRCMIARLQVSRHFPAPVGECRRLVCTPGVFGEVVNVILLFKDSRINFPGHARRPILELNHLSNGPISGSEVQSHRFVSSRSSYPTFTLRSFHGWFTGIFSLCCHQFTSPESFDSDRDGNPPLSFGTVLSQ